MNQTKNQTHISYQTARALKKIRGCPNYKVSSDGKIFSFTVFKHGMELKQVPTHDGYMRVNIYRNGKARYESVARIVAEAFIGPGNGRTVNHKDFNKRNNRTDNLEYLSALDNHKHAYVNGRIPIGEKSASSKLTEQAAKEVLGLKGIATQADTAREYGISPCTVARIWKRETWRHL